MRALNIAGLVAGLVLVVVSPPSTVGGMLGLVAGLALAGVNIYALLKRRRIGARRDAQGGGREDQ